MEKNLNIFFTLRKKEFSDMLLAVIVQRMLTYSLSVILLFSGFVKIVNPTSLIDALMQELAFLTSDSLSDFLVISIASILPIIEIGLGLLLFFSIHHNLIKAKRKEILTAVVILFSLFFLYSLYGFWAGGKSDCGCFGTLIKSNFGWGMIIRNFTLFFTSLILFLSCRKNNKQ